MEGDTIKISANGYITIIIVAAFLLIGYLFATSPQTASNQLPLILAAVGGLIVVIRQQGATVAEVGKSIASSEHNATKIADVGEKVADVHTIVNSHSTAQETKIARLEALVRGLDERVLTLNASLSQSQGALGEQRTMTAQAEAQKP